MATSDEGEDIGVVVGALFGFFVLVFGVAMWKSTPPAVPAAAMTAEAEIAPVGEALAKVYFALGQASLNDADKAVVSQTLAALALNPKAIVLLSGFHDTSGDPAHNAVLAKGRAEAVRDALVTGGVAPERVKLRKPESTVGTGSAEEGRRVEIRVQ